MRFLLVLSLVLAFASPVSGADWPQWRGPNFNGSTEEKNLPTDWSQTENVAWVADLPGPSGATPVVSGDHVFVSSVDAANETLKAMCFNRRTGKLLWQHEVASGLRQDHRSTYSSPSPVTDGELAVFFYGNGEMVAFDFAGTKLWSRNIEKDYGPFAFGWTFSTSPLLFENRLYLQVLQRDVPANGRGLTDRVNESYLLAMQPQTGETLWRQPRPSQAVAESRESFTTPIPFEARGRKELLVVGGDALTGHDPATGEELWRWGTWNPTRIKSWRLVPSPVANEEVILVCAPKHDPIYAIKTGGNGLLGDDAIAWTSKKNVRKVSSDVPTPAYYEGDFFVLSDVRKTLSRVEPKTGNVKWSVPTPGTSKYEASPLAADGKIYLLNQVAEVAVLNAENGDRLNRIAMGGPRDEPVRSSIIAAGGHLFLRTNTKLYCIGPKE